MPCSSTILPDESRQNKRVIILILRLVAALTLDAVLPESTAIIKEELMCTPSPPQATGSMVVGISTSADLARGDWLDAHLMASMYDMHMLSFALHRGRVG